MPDETISFKMKILVTGGAGYIGSHVVKALGEAGYEVLTYDNLSTGNNWSVLYGELIAADLSQQRNIKENNCQVQAGCHYAFCRIHSCPRKCQIAAKYYQNNTVNTLNLLGTMMACGARNFIFSSTAAVYGNAEKMPVGENAPMSPVNPYGSSK